MKDLRCILGQHKFEDWFEIDNHLERKCFRCKKVEVKYPNPISTLIQLSADFLWKYYLWNTMPKKGVYFPPEFYKIRDHHKENL